MKKLTFLLSIVSLVLYSCQQAPKDSFTIHGDIRGLEDPYIYLRWQGVDSTHLDSAAVTEGRFTFRGKVANPGRSMIYLKDYKGYTTFFLENADIHITGVVDSISSAEITGSQSQDEYEAYRASLKEVTDKQEDLYKQYDEARKNKDSVAMASLESRLNALSKGRRTGTKTFISEHPKSFVSLSQLRNLTYSTPYAEVNKLFTGLDASVQNSAAGKKFSERLAVMEKTSIGKPAPAFVQNDVNGRPVNLSDFKGKYVLVDFWASWCGPCRAENPNVVKAYNRYKDKGFAVLGVSLDENAEKWEKAIEEDKLDWTQVSDLKGWKNEVAQQYGVNAIPANWLIDPNGMIIGHNLRGEALKDKLKEIFK